MYPDDDRKSDRNVLVIHCRR